MSTPRAAAAVVAAVVTAALVVAGCGGEQPSGTGAGTTVTPDTTPVGPAPDDTTDVTADEVWGLAQLVPPDGLQVTSAVRRPDRDGLPSYLLVGTGGPDVGRALCDQVGVAPVPAPSPSPDQLLGWGLDAPPAGTLLVCGGADPVVPSVQREVLLAEADGATTVRLSTYEEPLP